MQTDFRPSAHHFITRHRAAQDALWTVELEPETVLKAPALFAAFMPPRYAYLGEKFTIVGETAEDALFLLQRVGTFLLNIGIGFKVATEHFLRIATPGQTPKLLTIYLPDHYTETSQGRALLMDDLRYLLRDYRGMAGISLPQYAPIEADKVFFRRDTDEYGNYILPQ